MNICKLKKAVSLLLVLVMVICMFPVLTLTSSATGYDNGYSGGMAGDGYIRCYGIDVSEHQGVGFNFQNIKNNGYSFVILRCGFVTRKDYRFEEYYTAAKNAGLDVGVYFYSYATNASEASYEADRCLSYISGKKFEYPVYFDFEDSSANSRNGNTAYSICRTFLDKIANAGYLAGLYGYAGWMDPNYGAWVPTSSICGGKYECWMANYYNNSPTNVKSANYPSTYGMYQYTSTNYVGGVGPLDTNVCYKDYPSIVKTYGFNGYSASGSGTGPVDGVYVIKSAVDQNFAIDIEGPSMDNGANNHVWTRHYGDSQRYVIQSCGDGYYTIRSLLTGRYLDVAYGGSDDGSNVWQCYYIEDSDAQKWKITKNSDGTYSFFAKCNGKALDMNGGVAEDGRNVQIWTSNGSDAQKWVLEAQNMLPDGIYKFGNKADTNYVLNVAGNATEDGSNVWVWERGNDNGDRWVVQSSADGYCYIRELNSVKYLDVNGGVSSSGRNVQIWSGNGTVAQKWSAIPNTDGTWSFASCLSTNLYLDMDSGVAENGKNVQIWNGNGTNAQKWEAEAQRSINDGVYSLASKTASNQTIHVSGGSTERSVRLVMWEREDVMWEKIAIEYVGDGYYSLRFLNSNLYLDLAGGSASTPPGREVLQYANDAGEINGDNDLWRIVPNNDGSYNIVSKCNNLHLDRPNGADDNGTELIVWTANRGDPQKWLLNPTTVGLDGVWNIAASGDNSYVLDIAQGSTAEGANLMLNSSNGSDSQKFIVQSIEDQYYVIRALHSGRVLNIDYGSAADGTNVLQWSDTDLPAANEKWQIIPNADGSYSFVGVCNGLYLDLSNNTLADGTNVQMWTGAGTAAQKWNLTNRYAVVEDGVYQFLSAADTTFALDVAANTEEIAMANGTNVLLYSANNGAANQQMYLHHVGNGYYTIMNMKSGKYLDVQDWIRTYGANIQQYESNGNGDSQLWSVLPNHDGSYTFVSKCGGKTMDVEDGTIENSTNIRTWGGNATGAQKWYLTHTDHEHMAGDIVESVAATCMTRGYTAYSCLVCGETFQTDFVEIADHTVVIDPAVKPGCETTGLTEGSHCAVCETVLAEQTVIAPMGHTVVAIKTESPTCTQRGYTIYGCKYCEKVNFTGDSVAATGHTEVKDEALPATCTEDGLTEGIHCSVCDAVILEQKTVSATGHNWFEATEGDYYLAPTCTETGIAYMVCSVCGEVGDGRELPALGHDMVAGAVHPATCTEEGYTEYACSRCGADDIGDIVPAIGHDMVAGTVHPATCIGEGYTEYACSRCGADDIGDIVPALGHDMVVSAVHPATCTEDGYTEYVCSRCGADDIGNIITALGHTWVEATEGENYLAPTCTETGLAYMVCSVCGEVGDGRELPALGHNMVAGAVHAPTCTEDGYTEYACSRCGADDMDDIIPALGHSYSYVDNSDGTHTVSCTNAGCTFTETAAHTFVDGTCVCGAKESTEPVYVQDSSLTASASVVASSDISTTFTILAARVSSYDSFYLEVTKAVADGDPVTKTYGFDEGMEAFSTIESGGVVRGYIAKFTGISAKEMGDVFTVTLYAVAKDGTIHYNQVYSNSIKNYVLDQMATKEEFVPFGVAMLNYGSAAQVYFGYDTEHLVNVSLTDEQKIVPVPTAEASYRTDGSLNNVITPNVLLQNKVKLTVSFRLNTGDYYGLGSYDDFKMVVRNAAGETVATLPITVIRSTAAMLFVNGSYDGIRAKDMHETFTFTLYRGDTQISNTLHWSIEAYVKECRSGEKEAITNAMLVYGNEAAAYFG